MINIRMTSAPALGTILKENKKRLALWFNYRNKSLSFNKYIKMLIK
jgi:hypothetical protein